jgi:hypothetical protein
MAPRVFRNAYVSISGTDFSTVVKSVAVHQNTDAVEVTAMGDAAHVSLPGLRDDQIDLELYQDFGAGSIDAIITALQASTTGGTVIVRPSTAAAGTSNPSYTMVAWAPTYSPLDGSIGDALMNKVTLKPVSGGSIVRALA